ncbi:hypothetical protein C3486_24765 [Streptomyces sp. Ru73]|nr:hypothetical protein C3486_24765 [Streptomyces sp. Ru73]
MAGPAAVAEPEPEAAVPEPEAAEPGPAAEAEPVEPAEPAVEPESEAPEPGPSAPDAAEPQPEPEPEPQPEPDSAGPRPAPRGTGAGRWSRKRAALVAAATVVASAVAVVVVLVTAQEAEHGAPHGAPSARVSESPTAGRGTGTSAPAAPRRAEDGFSWVPPVGWNRTEESPREITYSTRDGAVQLAARQAPSDGGDLLGRWRAYADAQRGRVPGYRTLHLERTAFRGDPAVLWEYAYTQADRPYHGRQLGFRHRGRLYQLSLWYRDDATALAVGTYERVRSSFRTS